MRFRRVIRNFVVMQMNDFKPTVILVDADYVDGVAFDLTVNFERMLMRRIPQADLAQWLVCAALDGGCPLQPSKEGEGTTTHSSQETQVIFLYRKPQMQNFSPGRLNEDIDGKAFCDERLGEFLMSAIKDEVPTGEDLFVECVTALVGNEVVERIVLVPDMERSGGALKALLAREGRKKEVTLLAMQPEAGRGFQSEILGYSLMQALGIRGDELG